VKNPFGDPSHALPYGFVQSPVLATLVLAQSALGGTLRKLTARANVSVYVDDISLSSNDLNSLENCYAELVEAFEVAGFTANPTKNVTPCDELTVFNCSLQHEETLVLPEVVAEDRTSR
jgi:Reverse transcriptase (RNA-dependent DNA polymerase)